MERLLKEQLPKEQDQRGKVAVEERACEEQKEKVKEMTGPEQPVRDQNNAPTTAKRYPSGPCTLSKDLPMLTSVAVSSMAALSSPLNGIVYSSTPIASQNSASQMPTIVDPPLYQQQHVNTVVNPVHTVPVQLSAEPPHIVSSHHAYEATAGTHTAGQSFSGGHQVQSTAVVSQQLSPVSDQLKLDSSVVLKRVSIPKFAGNKKHYKAWKAAFNSCVDRARATPEYKLLRLCECLQGEALKVIENLGHSAAAYKAAKSRLERKYSGKHRALTLRLEELEAFKQVREGSEKDLEKIINLPSCWIHWL